MGFMQSFKVKRWESVESPAQEALPRMDDAGISAQGTDSNGRS